MEEANVAKSSKSARAFQLTLNEYDLAGDLLNYLRSLSPGYLLAGKEKAPTTGHLHMHVYVQFPNPRRLSLKKCLGAHIEKCFGSAQQNIKYIKKPDTEIIAEEGAPAEKGGKTIAQVKAMNSEERAALPIVYYNIVQKIESEAKKKMKGTEYAKTVRVYWLWGESGAGKTSYAIKQIGDREFNEVKMVGEFWHGVQEDCSIALYDDWRDTHMKPTELINFIDYNRHSMNIKGGSVRNNYEEIYITSLQSPEEIYKNVPEETKKQWLRRIKEIIKFEITD